MTITLEMAKTAILNEVNLKTLIQATIMHMQMRSLMKILLSLKYQATRTPAPTIKLNNSKILNLNVLTVNKVTINILNLNRNKI